LQAIENKIPTEHRRAEGSCYLTRTLETTQEQKAWDRLSKELWQGYKGKKRGRAVVL